jgi:hypothetical protein
MVNIISEKIVADGHQLLEQLDKANIPIDAALWLYSSEAQQWRLILASPLVHLEGPKHLYKHVQGRLIKTPDSQITLSDISVIDTSDPFITILRKAIKTGKGISDIRFKKGFIHGIQIESAVIYRSM